LGKVQLDARPHIHCQLQKASHGNATFNKRALLRDGKSVTYRRDSATRTTFKQRPIIECVER
jgi:hypothetical protein